MQRRIKSSPTTGSRRETNSTGPPSPERPIKTNYAGDFADAEWLAGWISLTYLKDPADAYAHFVRMFATVSYPISVARGAYWAGRAAEAMDESDKAEQLVQHRRPQPDDLLRPARRREDAATRRCSARSGIPSRRLSSRPPSTSATSSR